MSARPIVLPLLAFSFALAACGAGPSLPPGPGSPPASGSDPVGGGHSVTEVNPIPAENLRQGEPTWNIGRDATNREVELFADRISAHAGETITVMASSSAPHTGTWALYRIGWYGGDGARRVDQGGPIPLSTQPSCSPSADTALVRCSWPASFQVTLAPDALAGLYAIRVTRDDDFFALTPLVVVDDRRADLVMQASVTTWQAYNAWNGESLYTDASGQMSAGKAVQVSFDRPYATGGGLGLMLFDDVKLARFFERHGYDVTYTTNARVAVGGAAELLRGRVFVSSAHDEYWAGEERGAADAALDAGLPLVFLGMNPAYWKIRLEEWAGSENSRIITCYKGRTQDDPVQGAGVTGRFRDSPINLPENALIGNMYESWMNLAQPWVVADASSWLFAGTGLSNGDVLPFLVGYEFDHTFDNGFSPAGLDVVGRSPVVTAEGRPSFQETVTRRAPSGALVFGAGTGNWAGALMGGDRGDPRVERMTANILHEAIGLPIPDSIAKTPPLSLPKPTGPFASSVSTFATGLSLPTGVAILPDGSLAVLEVGRNRVVRVASGGTVSVLAGDGLEEPSNDGPGATARFSGPAGILALSDGTLLVADSNHHTIRRIATDAQHTVSTIAGTAWKTGWVDAQGTAARFNFPMGMVQDPVTGRILIADNANNRVRALDLSTGAVTTLAGGSGGPMDVDGPGASARFVQPSALAAAPAPDSRVFVVVTGGYRIKAIQPDAARTVVTLAGSYEGFADGSGTEARLEPQGGAVYSNGDVLFSDPGSLRVRALTPGTGASTSTVRTIAGSGRSTSNDGPGATASFTLPLGLTAASDGTIYVADAAGGAIRAVRR